MSKTTPTILVTGGAGLVGSELIRQLIADGHAVRAIYRNTPLPFDQHPNIEQVRCDILDVVGLAEAMQGIQEVYHAAAIVSFNPKERNNLFRINVEGTANVVNVCLDAGVRKLVHVSSVAALGRLRNGRVDETMSWTPETSNSVYGKSKHLGELEVWRGMGEGLSVAILNPSIILGAGDWNQGSSELFKSAYNEFPWYSTGTTGFVDVRDVAKAMRMLMSSDVEAQRFILSGTNTTYQDVFTRIAKAFGKKPPHKKITPFLAGLVWRWEAIKQFVTGKAPLVTKETAQTALALVEFDNQKLLTFLPEFRYHSLNDTIQHTVSLLQQKHQR